MNTSLELAALKSFLRRGEQLGKEGNDNCKRTIWKGGYVRFSENSSCKSGYRVKDTAVSDHLGNLFQTVTKKSCLLNEMEERGQVGDKVEIEVWNHLTQSLVYKREFLQQSLMFLLPLGSVYLHKHDSGYFSTVPSVKTSETIHGFVFFLMYGKQMKSFYSRKSRPFNL